MAKCRTCGKNIFWNQKNVGGYTFCSDVCVNNSQTLKLASTLTPEEVNAEVRKVHQGPCPKCGGPGPVDLHTSHRVISVVYVSSWGSYPQLSCRSCGRKAQIKNLLISFFAGWWGFPWGIIFTPVQVVRNLVGIFGGPKPEQPSPDLESAVRTTIVNRKLAQQAAGAQPIAAPPIPNVPLPSSAAAQRQQGAPASPFSDANPFN